MVLGVQVGDVPQGLLRCEKVQLQDGQGSLGPSAHVSAIRGLDQSIAVAAEVGEEYLKLYAPAGASASTTVSLSALPSDISPILFAVAGRRVAADNDGVARSFASVAVVDVLGQGTDDGHVEFGAASRPLTSPEREALLDVLAPRTVTFVALAQAQSGIADRSWDSALVLAAPMIDDEAITVTSELWCGQQSACSDGGSVTVAPNPDGTWSVTKSNGGWIN
jgi:hypothetical protein